MESGHPNPAAGFGFPCDRCQQPICVSSSHASPFSSSLHGHATGLGESYVVHEKRQQALPDLSHRLGRGDSAVLQATSMHEQLRAVSRLLELSEVLHDQGKVACGVPLCEECASGVLRELQRRLEEAHSERELLRAAFAELEAGEGGAAVTAVSADDLEREREAQREEEDELRAELEAARAERSELEAELRRLQERRRQQQEEEEARHATLNAAELGRQDAADESLRVSQLATHCERELNRLGRVSVYEDLFRIDVSGTLGTINALRLGRLPGVTVEWAELNAALGQVVLLVHTLARVLAGHFGRRARRAL